MLNKEIVPVFQTLKSSEIQGLKVSFNTHLAIRQIIRALQGPYSDLVAVEEKYLSEISPEFRQFEMKRNEILSTTKEPSEVKAKIDDLVEEYKDVILKQQEKNADWLKTLESDVPVVFTKLDVETHSDFFKSQLSNEKWGILSAIIAE